MKIVHEHRSRSTAHWLRQFLKSSGLAKFVAGFLASATLFTSAQGQANIKLSWNPSANPIVAGFNIYYGGASGVYTNKTAVGTATSLTIPNLIIGATYYFAETTYSAAGAESALSTEVSYTVPMPVAGLQLGVTPAKQFILTVTGPTGHTYDIQTTQDFKTWTVIGTVTVGANGSVTFTDTNAPSFSRRFYRVK
jgi:hypothetical protein